MAGSRRNELKALFGGSLPSEEASAAPETKSMPSGEGAAQPAPAASTDSPAPEVRPRSASGAVKAVGLSLNAMGREAEEARALRQALADGERVIGIEVSRIENSIVEDRLRIDGSDPDFDALVESMREAGQQVPVLLRPHPEKQGFYQTAYGHRRIRAASVLGREVKAIVRPLTDDELVLAQGKENAERRNLSFIERGMFARNLAERGFDRKVIGDALAVQKSELSRLIQVAEGVPERFIRAIGPAPKAGRDRWLKLGLILQREARQHIGAELVQTDKFQAADSDKRFQMLLARLEMADRPDLVRPEVLKDIKGKTFARIRRDGKAPRIEFTGDADPDFIDTAAEVLAKAYDEFLKARGA